MKFEEKLKEEVLKDLHLSQEQGFGWGTLIDGFDLTIKKYKQRVREVIEYGYKIGHISDAVKNYLDEELGL